MRFRTGLLLLLVGVPLQLSAAEPEQEYRDRVAETRREYQQKIQDLEDSFREEVSELRNNALVALREKRDEYKNSDMPGSFDRATRIHQRWEKLSEASLPSLSPVPTSRSRLRATVNELEMKLDQCQGLNQQLLANPSVESTDDRGRIAGWAIDSGPWVARKVPWAVDGSRALFAGVSSLAIVSQEVSLSRASQLIDDHRLTFTARVNLICHDQAPPDTGELVIVLLDGDRKQIASFSSGATHSTKQWKPLELNERIPPETRYAVYKLIARRASSKTKNNDANFDGASLVINRQ